MPKTVFQESAAKVAIGIFSQIKIFEITAFGHVTEVPTCYKAVEGSKEKYSVNGRSSHPDVFYKKVLLKVSRFPRKNICAGVSFK